MYFTANTVDDLLRAVLERLLNAKCRVETSRGWTREVSGILLKLRNPRARLSRSETKGHVFSCLGELLWYLAKSNKLNFISYYLSIYNKESEDGKTVHGAYGPRLYAMRGNDQMENILNLLKEFPNTRRAVIQLFDAEDIRHRRVEIPCTCTLQFLIRFRRLHMFTNMRSNDAFKGLPHDVFAFTMLQELLARTLNVEIGWYKHSVGSLHLYDSDLKKVRKYLGEGWQSTVPMPPMPVGDPWQSVSVLLQAESRIRHGKQPSSAVQELPHYWSDLVRLLQIFRHSNLGEHREVTKLKRQMSSALFNPYIKRREVEREPKRVEQMVIQFPEKSDDS